MYWSIWLWSTRDLKGKYHRLSKALNQLYKLTPRILKSSKSQINLDSSLRSCKSKKTRREREKNWKSGLKRRDRRKTDQTRKNKKKKNWRKKGQKRRDQREKGKKKKGLVKLRKRSKFRLKLLNQLLLKSRSIRYKRQQLRVPQNLRS